MLSSHNIINFCLGLFGILYLGVIFLLNRIPHVKVKFFGFFAVGRVTIATGGSTIYIKRIKIRLKFFARQLRHARIFNIVCEGVEYIPNPKAPSTPVEKDKTGSAKIDLAHLMEFCVPKSVLDSNYLTWILNQVSFSIKNIEIRKNENEYLLFEMIRLEYNAASYHRHRVQLLLVDSSYWAYGVCKNRLSKAIDLNLKYDVVAKCYRDAKKHYYLEICNVGLEVLMNKINFPLEHFSKKEKKDGNYNKDQTKADLSQIKKILTQVCTKFDFFEFKILNSEFSFKTCNISFANFQAKLEYSNQRPKGQNPLMLKIIMTQLSLTETNSKCVEIPIISYNLEFDPLVIFERYISKDLIEDGDISSSLDSMISSSFNITNPVINLYHDQLESLASMRRMSKPRNNSNQKANFYRKMLPWMKYLGFIKNKILVSEVVLKIHLPKLGSTEFHRESQQNLIVLLRISSLGSRLVSRNFRNHVQSSSDSKINLRAFFKVISFRIEVNGNIIHVSKLNLSANYNILENSMSLKLFSKVIRVRSINEVIFHVIRNIRNRRIELRNKMCSEAMCMQSPESVSSDFDEIQYCDIFDLVPSFISSAAVRITNIEFDLICKDGLPSHKIFSESLNEELDLKDFRRGITLRIIDVEINFLRPAEEMSAKVSLVQGFTSSECSRDFVDDFDIVSDYQSNNAEIDDISSIESNISESTDDNLVKVRKVLSIVDTVLQHVGPIKNSTTNSKYGGLRLRVMEIDGRIDIFLIWCLMYAVNLIKSFQPTVEQEFSLETINRVSGSKKRIRLDAAIKSAAFVTRLPNHVDSMIEVESLSVEDIFDLKYLKTDIFRAYAVSPHSKLWARIIVIKDFICNLEHLIAKDNRGIFLEADGIRFIIPNQFLVYTIFDNILTFAKAIKQIRHNFNFLRLGKKWERIMPSAVKPLKLPKIRIKSKKLGLLLENDIFENELAYIFELGKLEQKNRIVKLKAFEQKSEELLKEARDLEKKSDLKYEALSNSKPSSPSHVNSSHSNSIFSKPQKNTSGEVSSQASHSFRDLLHRSKNNKDIFEGEFPVIGEQNIDLISVDDMIRKIDHAREDLYEQFSTSWILKFKSFKKVKVRSWQEKATKFWNEPTINYCMRSKYKIIDYARGPLLFGAIFSNLDLSLEDAHFDDLHKFLFDYGKGQPKLEYSILVPLYISLSASSFYAFIKDYSLPVISFPSNPDKETPIFTFRGNFVVNEKLVHRKEEMRFIPVPFLPSVSSDMNSSDNFYSSWVPRTLTPVKFMFDWKSELTSSRACTITWCKSYSAGFSAFSAALDKFTKPKIDFSPIGWWDKIALIMHGKFSMFVANELCFNMKSSLDPYEIAGKAAGFSFVWKNNVELNINKTGKSEELLTMASDDFMLAIPRFSRSQVDAWNLHAFHEKSTTMDSFDRKYQKEVIKLSTADKVKWTLGFIFERNKTKSSNFGDTEERTSDFKKHYDVVVTNPCFEWHPDSYDDYRSDYIHMLLSVVSKSEKGGTYNAAYFTPLTFRHFFYWWNTLTKNSSMPIRRGNLFNDNPADSSSIKFGSHLFTIKYQLVFEPLSISHMYKHTTGSESAQKGKIAFTGLKGKFSSCTVDLHQNKEVSRYINEQLNINNKVLKLKMKMGGINVEDCDIRLVMATFKENAIRSYIESYLDGSSSSSSSSTQSNSSPDGFNSTSTKFGRFAEWLKETNLHPNDITWIDPDDFCELQMSEEIKSLPIMRIYPILKSPRFTYLRDVSFHKPGPFPFGKEKLHKCIIFGKKHEDTQREIISNRISAIEAEISEDNRKIAELNPQLSDEKAKIKSLKKNIQNANLKVKVLNEIFATLQDDAEESNISTDSSEDVLSRSSTTQSVATARKSLHDMREILELKDDSSAFHNRFVFHSPQLKWNNRIRDGILEYLQQLSDKRSESYFMSRSAIKFVENFINEVESQAGLYTSKSKPENKSDWNVNREFKTNEDILADYGHQLEVLDSEELELEKKYLVKFLYPQIQLISEQDPLSSTLVASSDLEIRSLSVNVKGMIDVISDDDGLIRSTESRVGVLFQDAHVFVFQEAPRSGESLSSAFERRAGEGMIWQDWLGPELIYDCSGISDKLVVERNSISVMIKTPNYLQTNNKDESLKNEVNVDISKLVLNADSSQYSTIYYVITDLIFRSKTRRDQLMEKMDRILSISDVEQYDLLLDRVKELQENISFLDRLGTFTDQVSFQEFSKMKDLISTSQVECERSILELTLIMKSLASRKARSSRRAKVTNLSINQIIWHLLSDSREPMVDLALAESSLQIKDQPDGSHENIVSVNMLQGFNLQKNNIYPELLMPYNKGKKISSYKEKGKNSCNYSEEEDPVLLLSWKTLDPVGGISIIKEARLKMLPIKVSLDYNTAKGIFNYAFPHSEVTKGKKRDSSGGSSQKNHSARKESRNPLRKIFKHKNNSEVSSTSSESIFDDSKSNISSLDSSLDDLDDLDDFDSFDSSIDPIPLSISKDSSRASMDLEAISRRSAKYISYIKVAVEEMHIDVSFHATNHFKILNVDDLRLVVPRITYTNKIWSGEELILHVRKNLLKILLGHTGKILGNKLKYTKRKTVASPLKQISDYTSFITIKDLESKGRSNDDPNYSERFQLFPSLNKKDKRNLQHGKHHHHSHQKDNPKPGNEVTNSLESATEVSSHNSVDYSDLLKDIDEVESETYDNSKEELSDGRIEVKKV